MVRSSVRFAYLRQPRPDTLDSATRARTGEIAKISARITDESTDENVQDAASVRVGSTILSPGHTHKEDAVATPPCIELSQAVIQTDRREVLRALVLGGFGSILATTPSTRAKHRRKERKKQKRRCYVNRNCALDEICQGGKCKKGYGLDEGRFLDGQRCSPQTCLYATFRGSRPNSSEFDDSRCQPGEVCHVGVSYYCGAPCSGSTGCPNDNYACLEGRYFMVSFDRVASQA